MLGREPFPSWVPPGRNRIRDTRFKKPLLPTGAAPQLLGAHPHALRGQVGSPTPSFLDDSDGCPFPP
jgi:hypothetical protein